MILLALSSLGDMKQLAHGHAPPTKSKSPPTPACIKDLPWWSCQLCHHWVAWHHQWKAALCLLLVISIVILWRMFTSVTTMSNSGSYPVTPITSQHYSSTPVNHSYSSHSRTHNPPLTTTLGLVSIHSLPHLAAYPACSWVLHVLDISSTLYHFHQTWFILPRPDLVLSPVIPCPLFRLMSKDALSSWETTVEVTGTGEAHCVLLVHD